MSTCTVRWRSSGGRGEFEYVPADTLEDRIINVLFEPLGVEIPAEVRGVKAQGKPRLRKFDKNNRKKFHLPQLVMAVARLPEPAREDRAHAISFPLENKSFVMDSMDFDIIDDDGMTATLSPLRVSILHSQFQVNISDRLSAIANDMSRIPEIRKSHPQLAAAVEEHYREVCKGTNSTTIRKVADKVIQLQATEFGMTNASSTSTLVDYESKPQTDLEENISGKEGRILTRIHVYKERDHNFVKRIKKYYRDRYGGKLQCEVCEMVPYHVYGRGLDQCMEAHHKVPIEELQPDSITTVDEMAIVCANCHRVIHAKKPCYTVDEVRALITSSGRS